MAGGATTALWTSATRGTCASSTAATSSAGDGHTLGGFGEVLLKIRPAGVGLEASEFTSDGAAMASESAGQFGVAVAVSLESEDLLPLGEGKMGLGHRGLNLWQGRVLVNPA